MLNVKSAPHLTIEVSPPSEQVLSFQLTLLPGSIPPGIYAVSGVSRHHARISTEVDVWLTIYLNFHSY